MKKLSKNYCQWLNVKLEVNFKRVFQADVRRSSGLILVNIFISDLEDKYRVHLQNLLSLAGRIKSECKMISWREGLRSTRWSSLMTSMKRYIVEGDIKCINTKWEIISSVSIWEDDLVCIVVHKLNMTQQCDYAAKIANPTWSSLNRSVVCGRGEIVQASGWMPAAP